MNNERNGYRYILIALLVIGLVVIAGAAVLLLQAAQTPSIMDPQDEDTGVYSIAEPIPAGESVAELQSQAIEPTGIDEDADESTDTGDTEADVADSADSEDPEAEETIVDPDVAASITASETLTTALETFLTSNGLGTSNFALAFKDLSTGETAYFNELKQWDAASTYKLPLNMIYYDKEAAGEISPSDLVPGTSTTYAEAHHQSLEFSNNELSEAMVNNYGSYDVLKRDETRYMTLSEAETDSSYYHHNYYCARQMMDVAAYLYAHQSQYQEALGYLEAAQPGQYFKRYISGVTIAQKYGQRDGYQNCAGIVFGEHPFVLAVYSYNTAGGEPLIGSLANLLYEYVTTGAVPVLQ